MPRRNVVGFTVIRTTVIAEGAWMTLRLPKLPYHKPEEKIRLSSAVAFGLD